ncbi:MAG: hypothetical protein ACRD96_28270, partial [Bryobacteraceae bacterium]
MACRRWCAVSLAASMLFAAGPADRIEQLGGKVERDAAGNVAGVTLRGTWINDAEMAHLAGLPHLGKLGLSHTRISDEGLLRLKTAPRIRELNLYYAEWITDQGMT